MSAGGSIRKDCTDSWQMLQEIESTFKDEVKIEHYLELKYLIYMFYNLRAPNADAV